MTNHLPMNTTHEYTDDQLQTAIDRACLATSTMRISLADWTKDWREEKAQRLSIAKTFLAALPHPTSQPTRTSRTQVRCLGEKPTRIDANKDGNIFVVYATQDPDRKKGVPWPWDKPFEGDQIAWFSLPDDILSREPTQEETWQAEFEKCFPDFDLTKQDTGGYLHAHAATAWRAFLAAKKGGAK